MNLMRVLILAVWLIIHGGGYVFITSIQAQKRQWLESGAVLSASTVQLLQFGDFVTRYGYLFAIVATFICLYLWITAEDLPKRVEFAE